jgi:hypothetical protein
MRKFLYTLFVIFFSLGLILAITNPSEASFVNRLQKDYGNQHSGMSLTQDQLMSMGNSRYSSFLFFSQYEYQFGNIGVRYLGIGSFIIPLNSYREDTPKGEEKLALR